MSFLQSEILLAIFKNLDSKEMLNIRTVSQFWFQVIDENKTLWRTFNPPIEDLGDQQRHNEEVGDDEEEIPDENEGRVFVRKVSTVELFDRKSQSSLQEVSMDGSEFDRYDVDQLMEILSRSKETLRILILGAYNSDELFELSWKLPHLVDYRLLYRGSTNKIRLISKMPLIDERNHFKVLWLSSCNELLKNHLYLLDNLVSLKVETWKKGSEWRSILDKPSRTLKHLTFQVQTDYFGTEISDLLFPNLQVLEIESRGTKFPSWFRISRSPFTLINNSEIMSFLPSISSLWIEDVRCVNRLASSCPELMALRAKENNDRKEREEGFSVPRKRELSFFLVRAVSPPDPGVNLIRALEQRKRNVDDGMEVEGIEMKQIKTLIVPFGALDEKDLEKLRGLVEEVIDLKTSSTFVEVEI